TSIDVLVRQCDTERKLQQDLKRVERERDDLRTALLDRLNDRGMTVNTYASAMATIDQNLEIVQKVELKVRDTLGEAVRAVDGSALDPDVKNQIRTDASELLSQDEKGPGFLDKARAFSETLSAIVKNAAEAAGPLIPVAKALALLLL